MILDDIDLFSTIIYNNNLLTDQVNMLNSIVTRTYCNLWFSTYVDIVKFIDPYRKIPIVDQLLDVNPLLKDIKKELFKSRFKNNTENGRIF